MNTCKCCGHPLAEDDVTSVLTPMQIRIFTRVQRAGTHGIARKDLFDSVYADRADGGPLNENIIAVQALKMRERLAPFGLTIRGSQGPGSRYYIRKITNEGTNNAAA